MTLSALTAVRCWSSAIDINSDRLDEAIRRAAQFLVRRQDDSGRIDLAGAYGHNEVGFTLPGLVEGYRRLAALPGNPLADALADVETYLRRGAEAVVGGDAYTANHRWAAACAPLAAVHSLWPDHRYLAKIEDYLADGTDCDENGCWYVERSPNYNMVADHGLLVMAEHLGRPELLEPVLRSFEFILHCLQPNGEIDSTFSHRQDRAAPGRAPCTFGVARRVAQLSGDGRVTTLAGQAWAANSLPLSDLMPLLFELDRHPGPLPEAEPLPTHYERYYPSLHLARIRRGASALTLAGDPGGHYFDLVPGARGGTRSDDWFHLHHGEVVIESLHVSAADIANLQPDRLCQVGSSCYALEAEMPGWTHTLHFRPGHPALEIPWCWSSQVEVGWHDDEIELNLASTTPECLLARLHLWVRPQVVVEEPTGAIIQPQAGETLELTGGGPVVLRAGSSAVELHGFPAAAHRMPVTNPSPIPSAMAQTCADLTLGLRFPIQLSLRFVLR